MPVRIRLAYHPLARKKEPLYHIVVANSKTARQRKPLEVIGVYDPIPRYPVTPTGEVLENESKIKKISMNIDRVKYWLSVGAQPTDHCIRLFTKANLMPEKPLYKRSLETINLPSERFREAAKGWGRADQGLRTTLPSQSQQHLPHPEEPTSHIGLISQGEEIQTQVRSVSQDLVKGVFEETLPPHQQEKLADFGSKPVKKVEKVTTEGDTAAYERLVLDKDYRVSGPPDFDNNYATMPIDQLKRQLLQWYLQFTPASLRTDKHDKEWSRRIDNLRATDPAPLRFFMAYIKPNIIAGKKYNLPRWDILRLWMDRRETHPSKRGNETLFATLKGMFEQWDWVIDQIEMKRKNSTPLENGMMVWELWGPKDGELKRDIKKRRIVLEAAERHKDLKDRELDNWNSMWKLTLAEQKTAEGQQKEPSINEVARKRAKSQEQSEKEDRKGS